MSNLQIFSWEEKTQIVKFRAAECSKDLRSFIFSLILYESEQFSDYLI